MPLGESSSSVSRRRLMHRGSRPVVLKAALGLKGANGDAEINSWGDLIRRGISPRLRVEGFAIGGFPLGPVIAFHVPASYARPHMVSLNDVSRFYSRHSVGKYQMDVRDIRDSFLA